VTRRSKKDLVSYLAADERGEVLEQLLKKHADLRREANAFAKDKLDGESSRGCSNGAGTGWKCSSG